jgi:primosomal protein N' (replication factor Y)
MPNKSVQIVLDIPLFRVFDYSWDEAQLGAKPKEGMLVQVEFGKTIQVGAVVELPLQKQPEGKEEEAKTWETKPVLALAPIPPIDQGVMRLAKFASKYYLKPLGEVLLSTIPVSWKKPEKWDLLIKRLEKDKNKKKKLEIVEQISKNEYELNPEQALAVKTLIELSAKKTFETVLLKGVTGSGKTAVYLKWIEKILEDDGAQCLLLVPEINLTPQLEEELKNKFPNKKIAVLHSNVASGKRAQDWLSAHLGEAELIVGTRLSIMASIPNLKAIVVDEEHDASYKQQEGVRYSARDLAIWRASDLKIPVALASATPSCETWQKALEKKITTLVLANRARVGAIDPQIILIDAKEARRRGQVDADGLTSEVRKVIQETLSNQLQSLIFINRRGYAPVLTCSACDWKSSCPHCSSFMVLHKKNTATQKNMLHCHHCGLMTWIPKKCPDCGNQDISTLGNGTQKVEDNLEKIFPTARVLRVDTDATRKKGSAQELFNQIHDAQVDIIVGTQMLSKGHDFDLVDTVVVLDADKSLYSQDFRAGERLFAQLLQVAGRSGRSAHAKNARILIQTEMPEHPLYQALKNKNIDEYLTEIAQSRQQANLPPYASQALLIAEGRYANDVIAALNEVRQQALQNQRWPADVEIYDAVPRAMAKVAGKERAQLLIESAQRQSMQKALEQLLDIVEEKKKKSRTIRYTIERDPSSY